MHANDFMEEYLRKLREVCLYIDPSAFAAAASILEGAYLRGSTVYTCGNGGSAAIANHMVCDHSKGIRTGRQLATSVVSLSTNIELITAIANDILW
jgi:phosphoheptose isomerase